MNTIRSLPDPKAIRDKWVQKLAGLNGWWKHDGDLSRPFVALAQRNISSVFANCGVITTRPHILEDAVHDLLSLVPSESLAQLDVIIGSSHRSSTLAYEIARQLRYDSWYVLKNDGGALLPEQFHFSTRVHTAAMADDVVTTFGTTRAAIRAVRARIKQQKTVVAEIFPITFALVNRSGQNEIAGHKIVSLISLSAPMWKRGHNPFTKDGREKVPPVQPEALWPKFKH